MMLSVVVLQIAEAVKGKRGFVSLYNTKSINKDLKYDRKGAATETLATPVGKD